MEQFHVKGMSCAACSARVEKAVSKVPGVTSCTGHRERGEHHPRGAEGRI